MNLARYQAVFAWFNARPAAKRLLKWSSRCAVAAIYAAYMALLGVLAWQRQALFWGVLCVPAAAFLVGTALRAGINRPRPYETLGFTPLFPKHTRGKSMPSRHCFCAAAISVAAAVAWAPLGAVLAALAVLIAVTRVVTGVHYISDVLAGLLFGAAVGAGGFWLYFMLV